MATRTFRLLLLSALATIACAAAASPTVINFEGSGQGNKIANGDYGYNWDNVWTLNGTTLGIASGYQVAQHSGDMLAYGSGGNPCSFSTTDGSDTILGLSGYFASAWSNSNVLKVEALRDGAVVNTQNFTLDTYRQDFLNISFGTRADSVRFSTTFKYGYEHFGMDDLTIQTSPVPEPASLVTLGLGGLALLRRRKK